MWNFAAKVFLPGTSINSRAGSVQQVAVAAELVRERLSLILKLAPIRKDVTAVFCLLLRWVYWCCLPRLRTRKGADLPPRHGRSAPGRTHRQVALPARAAAVTTAGAVLWVRASANTTLFMTRTAADGGGEPPPGPIVMQVGAPDSPAPTQAKASESLVMELRGESLGPAHQLRPPRTWRPTCQVSIRLAIHSCAARLASDPSPPRGAPPVGFRRRVP